MKGHKNLCLLLLLIQLCICLSGCREYGEKRIVKMLSITEKEISILVYNYDEDKVQYDKISKKNEGIQNTIIDILKQERFNLKLCQYCFIDEAIAKNKTTEVFMALNSSKFSPDINLVCADNFDDMERYLNEDLILNPIYNFKYDKGKINAVIPYNSDEKSKIIIKNGKNHGKISETEATLLNILTNQGGEHRYNFSYNGKSYSGELKNSQASYGVKNKTLNVEIFAKLISYTGMPSGKNNKKEFIKIMKQSVEKTIEEIYADTSLIKQYNLFWYNNVKPFKEENGVKIDIIIK